MSKAVKRLSATTNAVGAGFLDDVTLAYIVSAFDRLKVSIYGLDEEEYRLMTRRDEYGQALAGISRILKHSRGNVVFGIRQLRNRPAPDVRAWVDKLAESSGCRQPIPITESVLEYRSWSRQKPRLPLDASWMAGGSPDAGAQCLIPLARPLVTSEGGLSYCHCPSFRLSGELMLGNLEEHSLRELYNSERCAELFDWQRYGVPSYCRTCSTYVPISTARFVSLFKEPWLW